MAKKVVIPENEHKKWEFICDFEDEVHLWKYDSKFSKINPIEIEILSRNDKSDAKKISSLIKKK